MSLAERFPHYSKTLNLLITLSFVLLPVGIFAPLMSLSKFYIFSNQISLAGAVWQLAMQNEWLLFLVLCGFSIIFPFAKLIMLFLLWNLHLDSARLQVYLKRLAHYGKWSMLDVFVVALLTVTVKLGGIAEVRVHYGLYAFAVSVLCSMLATGWIIKLTNH